MLKEMIEALAAQAINAAKPQYTEIDPTKMYAVRKPDGTIEFIGNRHPWRKHKAKDLETIVAFAERFDSDPPVDWAPAIWYSRHAVTCLIDDDDVRQFISVEMLWSEQIAKMIELGQSKPMLSQFDLLYMFRTVFKPESLTKNTGLIESLRKMTFSSGSKADVEIGRGKSSVGKSIAVEVTGQTAIPEQVTISVPVFNNAFARRSHDVLCALEIFENDGKFKLFPLPGEVELAFAEAEANISASLRDLLGTTDVPVYYGQP